MTRRVVDNMGAVYFNALTHFSRFYVLESAVRLQGITSLEPEFREEIRVFEDALSATGAVILVVAASARYSDYVEFEEAEKIEKMRNVLGEYTEYFCDWFERIRKRIGLLYFYEQVLTRDDAEKMIRATERLAPVTPRGVLEAKRKLERMDRWISDYYDWASEIYGEVFKWLRMMAAGRHVLAIDSFAHSVHVDVQPLYIMCGDFDAAAYVLDAKSRSTSLRDFYLDVLDVLSHGLSTESVEHMVMWKIYEREMNRLRDTVRLIEELLSETM